MSAQPQASSERQAPEVLSARALLSNFKPLETVIDGVPTPRGGLVAVTGPTGAGKTTLMSLMQVCFCRGRQFAGRDVTQGSVLVLAGENPDDYTMHLAATVQDLGLDAADLARPPPAGELLEPLGCVGVGRQARRDGERRRHPRAARDGRHTRHRRELRRAAGQA